MLYGMFMVCAIDLAVATVLLLLAGSRLRRSSWLGGVLLVLVVVFLAGQATAAIWALPGWVVEVADVLLAAVGIGAVTARPVWNPIGQLFFSAYVCAALTYLAFAADITVAGHLSALGTVASAALFLLELTALVLASSFVFETCDVITRVRHSRRFPEPDPAYLPMVSLHIASYNEPPDMLIETIKSVEQMDYPNWELVVVDNNTHDETTWRPVEEYCRDRPHLRFVHVDPWPGYKSGALNLALSDYTHPDAEIVGVIDADYRVNPQYLRETVGYFADRDVAFVQTPQDYREYEGSAYLTACYDAYRYFFATAMPSRNERNSIIFAGTMGLLRKSLLADIGGWDEWCITEDAETSLRLLKAGYSGMFVAESFGQGIMPLTFASLKSQRFRWCFGGMQILRRHWRCLMPWDRAQDNHLSLGQRLDYLFGGLQWLNDLIVMCFSLVLLVVAALLLAGQNVAIRPLVGPTLLLPAMLLMTGLLRAIWALKERTRISYGRALLAFANWLSLSFTVTWACLQGLLRSEGVFLRTPKTAGEHKLWAALVAARTEIVVAALLWGCGIAVAIVARPTILLIGLMAWQGAIYFSSPLMSWLAQHTQLSPDLERRRRTEERRERFVRVLKPVAVGTTATVSLAGIAFVAVLALGASNAGHPANVFSAPTRSANDQGPWGGVLINQISKKPTAHHSTKATKHTKANNPAASTSTTTGPATGHVAATTTTAPASTTTGPAATTTTTPAGTTTTPAATTTTAASATTTSAPAATTTTAPATTTSGPAATTTTAAG